MVSYLPFHSRVSTMERMGRKVRISEEEKPEYNKKKKNKRTKKKRKQKKDI